MCSVVPSFKIQVSSRKMEVIKTDIEGVLIIEPKVFGDKRGYFFESFSQREFDEKVAPLLGHTINFVQDNESMSSYGVMRGLHFQRPPFTRSGHRFCRKPGSPVQLSHQAPDGAPEEEPQGLRYRPLADRSEEHTSELQSR